MKVWTILVALLLLLVAVQVSPHVQRALVDVRSSNVISEPVPTPSPSVTPNPTPSPSVTTNPPSGDTNAPSVPEEVLASDLPEDDGTQVRVTWKASSDPGGGAVVYQVKFRPADTTGEYTPASQEPVRKTTLDVGGLTKEQSYEFVVAAIDQAGNTSADSPPATATPTDEVPQAPRSGPNAVGGADGITVSWVEASEADTDGYTLERAEVSQGLSDCKSSLVVFETAYTEVAQLQGKANTTYLDPQVESGKQYCYRYQVFDNSNPPNHSGYSPSALATRSSS